jgi:hypothetical protein
MCACLLDTARSHALIRHQPDQARFVEQATTAIDTQRNWCVCLHAPAGAGKTTCFEAVLAHSRARGHDVIVCASTGIAALLLTCASTLHMRFGVPLTVSPDMTLNVTAQSQLGRRLKNVRAILWDEAFMLHRYILDALDRCLRDLCKDPDDRPFGGKTLILATDSRQTLPVQPGATTAEIVDATHQRSKQWKDFVTMFLPQNLRVQRLRREAPPSRHDDFDDFESFLTDLGEMDELVQHPPLPTDVEDDPPRVNLRVLSSRCRPMICRSDVDRMLDTVYGGYTTHCTDFKWLADRAILCPRWTACYAVNNAMLDRLPGEATVLTALNEFCDDSSLMPLSPELLNGIDTPGIAPHSLRLKRHAVLILMRNLAPTRGLSNGTRLLLLDVLETRLRCVILTGKAAHVSNIVLIPRIWFILDPPNAAGFPCKWRRRQFPVRLAWSMSINKSQGQTLACVAVCLAFFAKEGDDESTPMRCFAHGQLYVALSRVGDPEHLTLFLGREDLDSLSTYNVVLRQVLMTRGRGDEQDDRASMSTYAEDDDDYDSGLWHHSDRKLAADAVDYLEWNTFPLEPLEEEVEDDDELPTTATFFEDLEDLDDLEDLNDAAFDD